MANIRRSRKSGFTFRGGVLRRETFWLQVAASSTTLASGTPVLFTGFSSGVLSLRPFTIIRVRGFIDLASDQVAASESYMATFGMAVVSEQALAVGVTAVPNPVADRASDLWFLYETLASSLLRGDGTGFNDGAGTNRQFDSRAMRKVEDGQDVAAVVENDGSPFLGCNMAKVGRMLLKLH